MLRLEISIDSDTSNPMEIWKLKRIASIGRGHGTKLSAYFQGVVFSSLESGTYELNNKEQFGVST